MNWSNPDCCQGKAGQLLNQLVLVQDPLGECLENRIEVRI